MTAALRVLNGYLKGRVIILPDERSFVLGSSLEADLTIFGTGIQDRHATFEPTDGQHKLVPLGPESELTVDGETVDEDGHELVDGETILLGKHKLRYIPLLSQSAIKTSNEFSLDEESGETVAADQKCMTCGDTLGPDPDAVGRSDVASLHALNFVDGTVCPRCIDRRLMMQRDLGEFRIIRKTASNELEVTYLGIEIKTGRRVGLRILKAERCGDEAIVRRFLARALVGYALGHPNFVEVVSVSATKGITFVVMEHVESAQKLERIIRDKAPIATQRALLIVNQLAEILRFARERGVVVAKRKKTGILVGKTGWVKVLSFDLTKEVEERIAASPAYQNLAKGGSRHPYTAPRPEPESLLRLAPERAEILGLARIFFQLLSGRDYDPRICVKALERALDRAEDAPLGAPPPKERKARLAVPASLDHVPRPVLIVLSQLLAAPNDPFALATLESVAVATKAAYLELTAQPH
ncbi:MAG: FHA domain-containing protein [Planctomycetota bacterium]